MEAVGGPAGAATVEAFFSRFPTVVLVANSDAVDVARLRDLYGEDALLVFFNKVYKVLSAPFGGACLLVARSGPAGANIVYRREVAEVLRLVEGERFQGILNLRCGANERLSEPSEFGAVRVSHLDLAGRFDGFYPETHVATSGFGLALFLAETCPQVRVVLAGFTARRSTRWRLFDDHDWTFEQIVLRLLFRTGALEVAPGSPGAGEAGLDRIVARLPSVTAADVALVSSEVLSERLSMANSAIDRLLKLTRLQGRIEGWIRSFKPRTRKARLAEESSRRG